METRLRRLEREAKVYRVLLAAACWVLFCGQKPQEAEFGTVKCRRLLVTDDKALPRVILGDWTEGDYGLVLFDPDLRASRGMFVFNGKRTDLVLTGDTAATPLARMQVDAKGAAITVCRNDKARGVLALCPADGSASVSLREGERMSTMSADEKLPAFFAGDGKRMEWMSPRN
ncbi:MAG: hypothetical protein HY855_17750 [Burkholderiales bacterium]|nr:hypothetical protein [Burkholderiales bacterium]